MSELSKLEYEVINETKCGKEELSILIAGFKNEYDLNIIIDSLVKLVGAKYLICTKGNINKNVIINRDELDKYINKRIQSGEKLEEYPHVCDEYYFFATDDGISLLKENDKPITSLE